MFNATELYRIFFCSLSVSSTIFLHALIHHILYYGFLVVKKLFKSPEFKRRPRSVNLLL